MKKHQRGSKEWKSIAYKLYKQMIFCAYCWNNMALYEDGNHVDCLTPKNEINKYEVAKRCTRYNKP